MRPLFAGALERYGQRVRVGGESIRAFFQPDARGGEAAPFTVTALGTVDGRRWIYLGLKELQPGDRVEFEGRGYTVGNSRPVRVGDELSHWWAALTAEREAEA